MRQPSPIQSVRRELQFALNLDSRRFPVRTQGICGFQLTEKELIKCIEYLKHISAF
jgi:hypothetical protein